MAVRARMHVREKERELTHLHTVDTPFLLHLHHEVWMSEVGEEGV